MMILGNNFLSLPFKSPQNAFMKRLFYTLLFFFGIGFASAQSYAFIDSDYIMKSIPEYIEAKEKIDKLAVKWTKEVEDRYAFIKIKKDNFNKEEVLLPSEEKEKRRGEIANLEKETIELQSQYFGDNGEYFLKRQELVQPIQDRVFNAMKKIAKREGYAFVFDKANQSNLVYAEKEYDISNTVLEEMGISSE